MARQTKRTTRKMKIKTHGELMKSTSKYAQKVKRGQMYGIQRKGTKHDD